MIEAKGSKKFENQLYILNDDYFIKFLGQFNNQMPCFEVKLPTS